MNKSEKKRRARIAAEREAARDPRKNPFGEACMTLGEAVQRYQLTGKPIPAHLRAGMVPVKGTEKPKVDTLPQDLQINRPFYRMKPLAHTGNENPCHIARLK